MRAVGLTKGERRCLADIERQLASETPRLARRLRAFTAACRPVGPAPARRRGGDSSAAASRRFVQVAFAISALLIVVGIMSHPRTSSAACVGAASVTTAAVRVSGCRPMTCPAAACAR